MQDEIRKLREQIAQLVVKAPKNSELRRYLNRAYDEMKSAEIESAS